MPEFRINATFETIGGFWTPQGKEPIMLLSSQGRVEFISAPAFSELSQNDVRKAFENFGSVPEVRIQTLQGSTRDGNCTLFGLSQTSAEETINFSKGFQVSAPRFRVDIAVMGLQLQSFDSELIESAAYSITKIHQWLPSALQLRQQEQIDSGPIEIFRFSSIALQAEIICEVLSVGRVKARRKTTTRSIARIRVVPRMPRSADWFISIGPRLENFFALFLGASVALQRVQIFRESSSGWIVYRTHRKNQKVNIQGWVRCEPHRVAGALAYWLATPDSSRAVEQTLLGMLRKSSLFTQTEFLGLVQALEAFGRIHFATPIIPKSDFKAGLSRLKKAVFEIWGESEIAKRCGEALGHANEASFADKIRQTYDLLDPRFSGKLLGERQLFIQKVVQTRNYFTHLGINRSSAVVDDGKGLFLLNQQLHAFLRCVMLLELGVQESELEEPVMHQATRWS